MERLCLRKKKEETEGGRKAGREEEKLLWDDLTKLRLWEETTVVVAGWQVILMGLNPRTLHSRGEYFPQSSQKRMKLSTE